MSNYKIYAVNYADAAYEYARCVNSETARTIGKVDEILEFHPEDIADFQAEHSEIFAYKRGAGLWLWKPYVIYKALQQIEDGAWLFYCDSGAMYYNNVRILVDCAIKDGEECMVFQLTWASAHQYTKAETFEWMGWNDRKHYQVIGGYQLWKKTQENLLIVKEWLDACCEERLISPNRFDESIPEDPEFISHREDQSIFDIIVRRHGIKPYRDPSDYGVRNYFWNPLKDGERKSPYPVIILSFRRNNPDVYKSEFRKRYRLWSLCLQHFGIYKRALFVLSKIGMWKSTANGIGM
jgi:hypothetical protein